MTGTTMRALVACILCVYTLSACTTVLNRQGVPEDQVEAAKPYGIDRLVRMWGDTLADGDPEHLIESYARLLKETRADEIAAGQPLTEVALALSGGGPDGAFGAGLLNGWTARGDRPEFSIVTGISTGAIIALFAYLGPDYDDELREVYTEYNTDELISRTIFAALTGGTAIADTRGYRALINRYVDDEVMRRLAQEHAKGRVLLMGTTNLDAARPVVWTVSGIAASGHPDAEKLIENIILASSAIPAVFPPVLIPVTGTDGRKYDEMHVDGGATQQVMLFSPEFPIRQVDEQLGVPVNRSIYVLINNNLQKPYDVVRPRLLAIAGTAVSSLLGGAGAGDIYKIFAIAQRDSMDLNVTWIPRDFDVEPDELFDPKYMKALYELGYEYGLAGDRWLDRPPDYKPWP